MISDSFKAHDARMGPKLGQSLASGASGLARRFGAGGQADRVEAARARLRAEVAGRAGKAGNSIPGQSVAPERVGAESGTGVDLGGIEARALVDAVLPNAAPAVRAEVAEKVAGAVRFKKSGPKGGRPAIEGKPWEAEGVSRRTWERRRKGGGG